MRKLHSFWNNLSVATKLYTVVGVMALMISVELMTLRFAMSQLSALRAFVAAEGMWSKGQKTSLLYLNRYTKTGEQKDFDEFNRWLEVPLGDHVARMELIKPVPDEKALFEGFKRGRIHPADIPGIVFMVRKFYWISYLKEALGTWQQGDELLDRYLKEANGVRDLVVAKAPPGQIEAQLDVVGKTNDELTVLQDHFSYVLGEGSRWMEHTLLSVLLFLVITVEGSGLFLSFTFARTLKKSLLELTGAAARIGRGEFASRLPVRSNDELGQLASALNLMAEELQASIGGRQKAERESETKSAFLANMSHEIRTPLSAILGFSHVLRDPNLSPSERDEYIDIIDRNGKTLTRVIDDILDLSKVEAGNLTIELLEFSLPRLLEDVVELFRVTAEKKNVNLRLHVESSARKAVRSDPTRLRQILLNLISNAIKFSEPGGQIEIHARISGSPKNEFVRISVRDNGIGIKAEHVSRLFQPFSQADDSTTRRFGGTGLGLVLSRMLAQKLGGTVELTATEFGRGSTFEVMVANSMISESSTVTRASDSVASSALKKDRLASLRVLVAEDSEDNRQLLKLLFAKSGVKPDFVTNGREAVERLNDDTYDVIFMDIQMPEMDGYEALRNLRAQNVKTPVIALTAHALTDERKRILDAGFALHLSKPIDSARLASALFEVI